MADYLAGRDGSLVPVQDTGTELTGRAADPLAKPARAYGPTHCPACGLPLADCTGCTLVQRMAAVARRGNRATGKAGKRERKMKGKGRSRG
jgi:hypothetical protein